MVGLVAILAFSCEGVNEDPKDEIVTLEGSLEITPSQYSLVAGPDAILTFSASVGDVDVTDYEGLTVYFRGANGSEAIENLQCTIEGLGDYEFFGLLEHGGEQKLSKSVWVKGVTGELSALKDPNPDKFDSFRRRTLGFQFTGTWCPNCPIAIKAIHDLEESEDGDDFVFVAVHVGDGLTTTASTIVNTNFSVASYPTIKVGSLSGAYAENIINALPSSTVMSNIKEAVDKSIETPAKTALSVSNLLVDNTVVSIRADIKVADASSIGVGSMILADNVYLEQQNNCTESQLPLGDLDVSNHKNVLLIMDPLEKPLYEPLAGKDSHEANEVYTYTNEFVFEDAISPEVVSDLRVVVYTYDRETSMIDNVISLPVGSSHNYEYTE